MSTEQRITARDLLDVLVEADALEIFNSLPAAAQEDLASWIGAARDEDSHWVRIQALVAAMKSSPLNPRPATDTNVSQPPVPDAHRVHDVDGVRFNDLLAAIRDSNLLGASDAAGDGSPRRDGDSAATLRVVYEVMTMLKDSGVLDVFFRLPENKQADFLRWIGTVADRGLRSDRTTTFIAALEKSPLASAHPPGTLPSQDRPSG